MISHNSKSFVYPDYISPLPSDEYIKYAEKKQTMYDEGLASVRQAVDTYSSLRDNIQTDVERQYFDQAMTNLVNGINKNAGIDFSYKGNVSAVLSMGKTIEKDQNILTALSNGKEIQRRSEALSKMDSSKRSAANDYAYMKDVSEYKKSGKLGQKLSYGKEYQDYYDISKKWQDFWSTIKNTNQSENIGQSKAYGPAYWVKETTEGFTKSEIADKFQAYLASDPKALQQLNIDVQYNLDLLGKENAYTGFIQNQRQISDNAAVMVAEADKIIPSLQAAYKAAPSQTTKAELDQALSYREKYNQVRVMASQKADTGYEDFDINDYAQIYKAEFISNMSNMYASQKVSRELIKNEYWAQQREDSRVLMKHNLTLQRDQAKMMMEKQDRYVTTKKDTELLVPEMAAAIKNVPNAINELRNLRDAATHKLGYAPDSNTIKNIEHAVKFLQESKTMTGIKQLNKLKQAFSYLGSSNVNLRLKPYIASMFGYKNVKTKEDYDEFISNLQSQLTHTTSTFSTELNKGKQTGPQGELSNARQISLSDAFDMTLNNFDDINFVLNGNALTGRIAIASPESVDYKYELNSKGEPILTGTKVSQKLTNKVNKGEKYKVPVSDTESTD